MIKKITYGAAIFLVLSTILLMFFSQRGVYGTYKCYYYQETFNNNTVNVLNNYDYYELQLKRNKTFTITFKGKYENANDETAHGTFTINNKVITLNYIEGQNPIEAILFPKEILTLQEDGTLLRDQTAIHESTNLQTRIVKKFKK